MAESTLSLDYTMLISIIGRYLGYGSDSTQWTTEMLAEIHDVLDSGMRQFYNPPPLPGQANAHVWSFLQPVETLEIESEVSDYDLPDNYGGMISKFSYGPSGGFFKITIVGEYDIRRLRQTQALSGMPQKAAVVPVIEEASPTRYQVQFWPTPDSDYTLYYRYQVLQDALRTNNPYPLGGAIHAETIKQSCLAIAEQQKNEERGVQTQLFYDHLARSIDIDLKNSTPDYLGYNSNSRVDDVFSIPRRYNTKLFYNDEQIL